MATQQDYDAATAALLALEQQIISSKGIPTFLLPSAEQSQQYAAMAAKAAVDAVDAERAKAATAT